MFFCVHFLNKDISVNIADRPFKVETCIFDIQMGERVSQNVDVGPQFYVMKCRNL